jgi:hypothetical protein
MTVAMFLQEVHLSIPGTIVGSLAVAGVSWLITYSATVRANAKGQGVLETTIKEGFKRADEKIVEVRQEVEAAQVAQGMVNERLDRTDRDQWKAIGKVEDESKETSLKVARIEGRMNGRGASAGSAG